ncbi:hypothetical protein ACIO3O_41875 [Streptomyces sp. NPDC087440]|uniref:hypothetical protein n=1 Tax=Streptomyces sp. NPDC087440 TaxID=3365790 RepID=UPI003808753A
MKRMLISGVVVLAAIGVAAPSAPAFSSSAVQAEEFNRCGYYVQAKALHIRSGPGTKYTSLGLLRFDDLVVPSKQANGWFFVQPYRDHTRELRQGWVPKKYLRTAQCMNPLS